MPSVYLPSKERVYRTKVGFHTSKRTGKVVRTEFRLGTDPIKAHKAAISLAEKWLGEEKHNEHLKAVWKETLPDEPPPPLVWSGLPDLTAVNREEYLAVPPETLPDDDTPRDGTTPVVGSGTTIKECVASFLQELKGKAERDQNAPRSYQWYVSEFDLGFVPKAINVNLDPLSLGKKHIKAYCNYWTDLKNREAESPKHKFGWRSAWNRIDALNALLYHMDGEVNGFSYPKGAEAEIAEAKKTVSGNMSAIWTYDADLLRRVLKAGDDQHRMFVYAFLNFGMYQSDVGQQIQRRYETEYGGFIDVNGELHLQWWRHKNLRRRRQMMRDAARMGDPIPVLLTHYVWPELWTLLDRFKADETNLHNKWLLNRDGLPLWRQEVRHKRPLDAISSSYHDTLRDAALRLPISQFRKFGATECESKADREVQEMYRGERRSGSSKFYVLGDYAAKLTPFLKAWGERLRADGVLF